MPLLGTDQHNWYPRVYLTTEQTDALEEWLRQNTHTAPPCLLSLLVDIPQWRRKLPDRP